MENEDINYSEFLQYIRNKHSVFLNELRESGKLDQYLVDLHQRMLEKYPEMIEKIYTDDGIIEGGMNR
jgi:hypothetical protein